MTPYATLANRARMPWVGLGLWKISLADTPGMVTKAIEVGYRHLDCACDYGNESAVGEGLKTAGRSARNGKLREELWVTSKLWNNYHAAAHVRPACERTLRDLGLDYLDLYLIHFPIALEYVPFDVRYPPGWFADPSKPAEGMHAARVPLFETWQAMEKLVQAGLVRHIGVCNYGVALLRDLLNCASIRPAVLQVEMHPFLCQEKLLRFCQQEKIAVTAFSPLGAGSYVELGMAGTKDSVLTHAAVQAAARNHGKTPAQVVLRWAVQRGTVVIPKTSRPQRLAENLDVLGFELSADEMKAISALDQHRRFNDPGVFCEAAFNTFFPIYE